MYRICLVEKNQQTREKQQTPLFQIPNRNPSCPGGTARDASEQQQRSAAAAQQRQAAQHHHAAQCAWEVVCG